MATAKVDAKVSAAMVSDGVSAQTTSISRRNVRGQRARPTENGYPVSPLVIEPEQLNATLPNLRRRARPTKNVSDYDGL
jgi:hypothetical protein